MTKYSLDQANIKIKNNKFNILKKFPKGKRISIENLWSLLNIKNYQCIDINKSNKSIYLDLNYPLTKKSLISKFDLVNDFETMNMYLTLVKHTNYGQNV